VRQHVTVRAVSQEAALVAPRVEDPRLTAYDAEVFEGAAAEEIVPEPVTLRSFINWLRPSTARRPKVPPKAR
jgi:hypothetical protein